MRCALRLSNADLSSGRDERRHLSCPSMHRYLRSPTNRAEDGGPSCRRARLPEPSSAQRAPSSSKAEALRHSPSGGAERLRRPISQATSAPKAAKPRIFFRFGMEGFFHDAITDVRRGGVLFDHRAGESTANFTFWYIARRKVPHGHCLRGWRWRLLGWWFGRTVRGPAMRRRCRAEHLFDVAVFHAVV